jgi:hypothetical protein
MLRPAGLGFLKPIWLNGTGLALCSLNIGDEDPYRNLMSGWPKTTDADCRRRTLKPAMSTEELHRKFNRRSFDQWGARLFLWLAAAVVFLFLLLVAPHTSDPNFVRALAVGWPILLAFVAAWRIRRP